MPNDGPVNAPERHLHHDRPGSSLTRILRSWTRCALLFTALLALTVTGTPDPARAGRNPDTKMIVHLVPFSNRSTCLNGRLDKPEQAVTKGDLFPAKYIAYVLLADGAPGAGFAGCQFGIAYDDSSRRGVDILDWTECSLFNWPEPGWPDAGTGNMLTWNQQTDCDTTGMRVVGYFTVTAYSPDRLRLIPRPADGRAAVIACGIRNIDKDVDTIDKITPENLGFVDFGGGPGYNPWNPKENLSRLRNPGGKPRDDRKKTP